MKKVVLLFISILLFVDFSYGLDDLGEAFKKLVSAKCIRCEFTQGRIADFSKIKIKIENDKFGNPITICSIDLKQKTAKIIGNQGSSLVHILLTPQGLTFMEQTGIGNLAFYTVFFEFKKGTKDFCSVTSRHINLPTGPLPSQYYGYCKLWE